MRSKSFKKSLAATAVLASSVATGVGFAASAQATSAGASNSPLTVTNGTSTVHASGQDWQYQGKIGQGSWAPDGSRIAYVDGNGNVVTERAGGGDVVIVAPARAGAVRSTPTWDDAGAAIVFSETVGGVAKIQAVPAYTAPGDKVQQTDPLSFLGSKMPEGTETAPESNGRVLAFQHHDATTNKDQIWVQDAFGRGSAGPILVSPDGTSPSVSPDAKTIAFLRKDAAGDEQIWTVAWNGQGAQTPAGTPKQLTTDAHDHLHPAFSPDGSRIAYEAGPGQGAAGTEVDSIAAAGGGGRQELNKAGVPAYQPSNANTMVRLQGSDRIGTAIATSQAQWATAPGDPQAGRYSAGSVVLTRSDQFADALGGSTLATAKGGPLLLTPSDHLDASVKAEIARVLGPAAKATGSVYILGGEQALSPAVANAVHAMGYKVQRIAGPDRYATSVAIAEQITYTDAKNWEQPERVLVATGNLSPDALSAGAAAEATPQGPAQGVVILTNDKTMPASTAAYLAQVKAHDDPKYTIPVYGVGGQADAALKSIGFQHTGLVGTDRYETSYLVAKTFFGGWQQGMTTAPTSVGFATGLTWADALSGGAFMGQKRGPLILVDPRTGEPSTRAEEWVVNWGPNITTGYVFGGTAAVPSATDSGMGNLIGKMGGPVNYVVNPKA